MKNITYKTDELAKIFTHNRITWSQFYDSERAIIEKLNLNKDTSILDIGCGCGGLGLALKERFGVENYTGVDINQIAAEQAKLMNQYANILCGDVLDLNKNILKNKQFDVVFSLSCVDWNVCFSDMLKAAWDSVLPGGYFIGTFRLTTDQSSTDIETSYQYINSDEKKEGELAAYVVLNAQELIEQFKVFNPSEIQSVGYWGTPSAIAVTPYKTLCFSAFSLKKRLVEEQGSTKFSLDLPEEIKLKLDSLK